MFSVFSQTMRRADIYVRLGCAAVSSPDLAQNQNMSVSKNWKKMNVAVYGFYNSTSFCTVTHRVKMQKATIHNNTNDYHLTIQV